ncbi:hypothetical protein DKL61_06770 [Gammaproteobacteria bacterium ESL0073]|nr:hypothetical protein DKL61_06770 [Gammaproteobacteria bacterium ESL0073]
MHINWALLIIFFFVWLAHFLPISDGLEKKFKLNMFLSSVVAVILSIIPVVNILSAIWGCIYGWRWKWWQSIVFIIVVWCIALISRVFLS